MLGYKTHVLFLGEYDVSHTIAWGAHFPPMGLLGLKLQRGYYGPTNVIVFMFGAGPRTQKSLSRFCFPTMQMNAWRLIDLTCRHPRQLSCGLHTDFVSSQMSLNERLKLPHFFMWHLSRLWITEIEFPSEHYKKNVETTRIKNQIGSIDTQPWQTFWEWLYPRIFLGIIGYLCSFNCTLTATATQR